MSEPHPMTALLELAGRRIIAWIGFQALMLGPHWVVCNANTRFGKWCLRHAGAYAYPHHPASTDEHTEG